MPPDDQLLLRAAGARRDGRRGRRPAQPADARPHAPFVPGPTRTGDLRSRRAGRRRRRRRRPRAGADARAVQRRRRLRRRRPRVRHARRRRRAPMPPVPWTNVVAHETFGFACTESGPGYTWSGNSHDNRLTPWRNDPVARSAGRSGVHPRRDRPARSGPRRRCRRAAGTATTSGTGRATRAYEHARDGVASELTLFVPRDDAGQGLPPRAEEHRRARRAACR